MLWSTSAASDQVRPSLRGFPTSVPSEMIEIDVPVEETPLDEIDLADYFSNFIQVDGDLVGPLVGALDLEVSNSRAVIDDFDIDAVTVHENGDVEIEYTFTWSAHFGCDDLNKVGQDHGSVAGVKKGGKWLFERHVYSQRSTADEF